MATKRMFSLQIVDTDAFLEMPMSSQVLYFHLAMRADDEGFVSSPKKIMKMVGTGEDDYKILIVKKFIIPFESGVCVIKHWLIHNIIRMDRLNPTTYQSEKNQLIIKENKSYKRINIDLQPDDNQMSDNLPSKLSKVKLSKVKLSKTTEQSSDNKISDFITIFKQINPTINYGNKTTRKAVQELIKQFGEEKAISMAKYAVSIFGKPYAPTITTPYQLKLKLSELGAYKIREGKKGDLITKI